mmetsp:Transcript_85595/g.228216  ORF Transcript_85595/g.228216 Transcript_85595/m.228216 type:complete len:391 (-) Transcript_85595:639-1811(-)
MIRKRPGEVPAREYPTNVHDETGKTSNLIRNQVRLEKCAMQRWSQPVHPPDNRGQGLALGLPSADFANLGNDGDLLHKMAFRGVRAKSERGTEILFLSFAGKGVFSPHLESAVLEARYGRDDKAKNGVHSQRPQRLRWQDRRHLGPGSKIKHHGHQSRHPQAAKILLEILEIIERRGQPHGIAEDLEHRALPRPFLLGEHGVSLHHVQLAVAPSRGRQERSHDSHGAEPRLQAAEEVRHAGEVVGDHRHEELVPAEALLGHLHAEHPPKRAVVEQPVIGGDALEGVGEDDEELPRLHPRLRLEAQDELHRQPQAAEKFLSQLRLGHEHLEVGEGEQPVARHALLAPRQVEGVVHGADLVACCVGVLADVAVVCAAEGLNLLGGELEVKFP